MSANLSRFRQLDQQPPPVQLGTISGTIHGWSSSRRDTATTRIFAVGVSGIRNPRVVALYEVPGGAPTASGSRTTCTVMGYGAGAAVLDVSVSCAAISTVRDARSRSCGPAILKGSAPTCHSRGAPASRGTHLAPGDINTGIPDHASRRPDRAGSTSAPAFSLMPSVARRSTACPALST